MIKKNLTFLKKYEKEDDGYIIIHHPWLHILCQDIQESHKIPDITFTSQQTYRLKSFLEGYKKVHGSRHTFMFTEKGLEVTTKKSGEVETIDIEKVASHPFINPNTLQNKGAIKNRNLVSFGMFEKFRNALEYVPFLQNPTIILDKDNSYIWGTDCIHQLRINFISKQKGIYNLPSHFKWISEWAKDREEEIFLEVKNETLIFFNNESSIMIPLKATNNAYEYSVPNPEMIYILNQKELEELMKLNMKTLLSQANKTVKESLQVCVEIVEGEVSLYGTDKTHLLTLSKHVSLPSRIEGYRFYDFIKDAKEIILTDKYIQKENTYLIL